MKDIKLKDKIAQGINDLFYIWKREFQTTFRDQSGNGSFRQLSATRGY